MKQVMTQFWSRKARAHTRVHIRVRVWVVAVGLGLAPSALLWAQPQSEPQPEGAVMSAASTSSPEGRWITFSGNLEVTIAPCGEALCGTVTQVLGNRSMRQGGDELSPVDARSAMGMKLLTNLRPVESGDQMAEPREWKGDIYNRENGKTYRCLMHVSTANHAAGELVLRAYVGLPLFGQTQVWQRSR